VTRLSTADTGFEADFGRLLARSQGSTGSVADVVAAIIADVRARGDAALVEYTTRFDRFTPASLVIGPDEIAAAEAGIEPQLLAALDLAAARIERFHAAQMPADVTLDPGDGVKLGVRWGAVDAVGLYVPGGKAAYPSSVLMNAIPARVAGVGRVAMCVPTPDGVLNPLVLAAGRRAGVTEIYRIGGAQAVAAMAYGTATIAAVDRIVGPGNAYVAEAKRQVFGTVGIDSIAGPSEVLIIADDTANPDHVAIDLLAQSEHDEMAQSILLTTSAGLADRVEAAVATMLPSLLRAAVAAVAWRLNSGSIVARDTAEIVLLANRIAAEHLQIMTTDPEALFAGIRHAGSVFLGHHAPTALGDYVAGPNHVLPTGGTARFASGLSVFDFLKRTTWTHADLAGVRTIGPAGVALAESEGLHAHARSLAARFA